MSTPLLNVSLFPFWSAGLQSSPDRSRRDKSDALLKYIAGSARLVSVRPASQFDVRPKPEMLSTGIPELDAITGGIPRGCLTEIYGASSSGKTSVLLATLACSTRREESCALIDASDSFDPSSGAAAGVNFNRLLWIRGGVSPLFASVVKGSEHRRHSSSLKTRSGITGESKGSERKLEQVLKAADLILQSGGFGLIALNLAGIPGQFARRIPLASWFRFQRAVEHTKTALLVVSEFSCAQTCAALVMKFCNKPSAASHQQSAIPTHAQVLDGIRVEAEIVRSRLERKPAQSVTASFRTQAVGWG